MVKNYQSELELEYSASQTHQLRCEADLLLKRLLEGREQSERRFAESGQRDAIKFVTGRSAIDNAIVTTRNMIREMDDLLDQMNADVADAASELEPGAVGVGQ